jgi:hypothetical protein
MRDKHASIANEFATRTPTGLYAGRHYAPSELAELWVLSSDTIRRLFQDEPGVMTIGERSSRRKRRYIALRIPESAAARLHRRVTK